jgi:large subunit ribosomal protein L17
MRHRKRGRVLGRSPSHRKAMLKNLASALFLTERFADDDENKPEVKGRIVTTVAKAKEVRPLVEKCVTLACKALGHVDASKEHSTEAPRNSDKWKEWRKSDAGPRAILEFVGVRDRKVQRAEKPAFSDEPAETAKA